jgi:carbon-monoxide dehydrogenase small subunit
MERLLDVLREQMGLTGTKEGCGEGECGACTVLIDGQIVNSCLVPIAQVQGCDIKTIEGIAPSEPQLHAVQQAFIEHGGAQCGICTPGMIIAAVNLLEQHPSPTEAEIRHGLAGNLCRCTGYMKIFESVVRAVQGSAVGTFRYFAYGSNMWTERLRNRVSSARPCGVATLTGYSIRFHKRSTCDHSGKCNIIRTASPDDQVTGVVFEIDRQQKHLLDQAEGGYQDVFLDDLNAFLYLAKADSIDENLVPYSWYKDFVIAGARENGLPEEYIQRIMDQEAVEDPDQERSRQKRNLLRSFNSDNAA